MVLYTVSSHGRPIGITDLAFVRVGGANRSGWLHPNNEGRQLLPKIASPLPAMRAFLHRDHRDARGASVVQPSLIGSTLFADIAEAFQHFRALELTVHREDGSLVPTELVGIQDTGEMSPLEYPDDGSSEDSEPWESEETFDEEELRDVLEDVSKSLERAHDLLAAELLARGMADDIEEWLPDDDNELPRYQIHVLLADEKAIP
jgi:hypothetical protein